MPNGFRENLEREPDIVPDEINKEQGPRLKAPGEQIASPEEMEKEVQELSKEEIEKIMEKVQDINKAETGLHVVSEKLPGGKLDEQLPVLQKILEQGILGAPYNQREGDNFSSELWAKQVRQRNRNFVFFNIVGRDIDNVASSYYFSGKKDKIGLIFDISKFKEDLSYENYVSGKPDNYQYQTRTFGTNSESFAKKREVPYGSGKFKTTKLTPYPEGHALSFRVAPRFLKGLILKISRKENASQEIIDKLARVINEENSDIPIYDFDGNLLWPKQMSYEEVKKFVDEREGKKEV